VIAVDEADILDLGALLDHAAPAFQLEILDDGDGVAILQHVAGRVAPHAGGFDGGRVRLDRPLMRAFRANVVSGAVLVGQRGAAGGAGGIGHHDGMREKDR